MGLKLSLALIHSPYFLKKGGTKRLLLIQTHQRLRNCQALWRSLLLSQVLCPQGPATQERDTCMGKQVLKAGYSRAEWRQRQRL